MKENKKVSLFINSATKALEIGILVGSEYSRIDLGNPKRALERVHLGIKDLCNRYQIGLKDVDAFYVLLGPGSNTGIRLGLTIPRTIYALNPNIEIYGIPTMNLFCSVLPHAALSDRNGNLYFGKKENDVVTFNRIDKKDIPALEKMDIAVEKKDVVAIDELKEHNLTTFNVLELMIEKRNLFKDYSKDEDNYLPEYLLKI